MIYQEKLFSAFILLNWVSKVSLSILIILVSLLCVCSSSNFFLEKWIITTICIIPNKELYEHWYSPACTVNTPTVRVTICLFRSTSHHQHADALWPILLYSINSPLRWVFRWQHKFLSAVSKCITLHIIHVILNFFSTCLVAEVVRFFLNIVCKFQLILNLNSFYFCSTF